MLSPDHPLAPLQADAALATGWPTLHVYAPSEAGVQEALDAAVSQLGALPQADIIAPWDETDPDEPWELRIDLPGLPPTSWPPLRDALRDLGWDAGLLPGMNVGARAARDQMRRESEPLFGQGLVADLWFDPEHGGVVAPDTEPVEPDGHVVELEQQFVAAIRGVRPDLVFRSERGDDTLSPVVDRNTGRAGVVLSLSTDQVDTADIDVQQLRQELFEAIAQVVHSRAEHPHLRLAPDVLWDTRLGLAFTLWRVGPMNPSLPGDPTVAEGLSPTDPAALGRAISDLAGELEVHVVPASADAHDDVVAAVAARIESLERPWLGAMPRWVRTDKGLAFTPVWRIDDLGTLDTATEIAEQLAALDEVLAVRVVPGQPTGMGELWATIDPAWWCFGGRCFVRWLDGVPERGRLEPVDEREYGDNDERTARALTGALKGRRLPEPQGDGPRVGRAIRDPGGRDGLEFSFCDPSLRTDKGLAKLLRALGRMKAEHIAALHPVAFRGDQLLVRCWER